MEGGRRRGEGMVGDGVPEMMDSQACQDTCDWMDHVR